MIVLMDKDKYQHMILDLVTTEKYKSYTNQMTAEHKKDFEAGFAQGLCWASLLSNQIESIYIENIQELL